MFFLHSFVLYKKVAGASKGRRNFFKGVNRVAPSVNNAKIKSVKSVQEVVDDAVIDMGGVNLVGVSVGGTAVQTFDGVVFKGLLASENIFLGHLQLNELTMNTEIKDSPILKTLWSVINCKLPTFYKGLIAGLSDHTREVLPVLHNLGTLLNDIPFNQSDPLQSLVYYLAKMELFADAPTNREGSPITARNLFQAYSAMPENVSDLSTLSTKLGTFLKASPPPVIPAAICEDADFQEEFFETLKAADCTNNALNRICKRYKIDQKSDKKPVGCGAKAKDNWITIIDAAVWVSWVISVVTFAAADCSGDSNSTDAAESTEDDRQCYIHDKPVLIGAIIFLTILGGVLAANDKHCCHPCGKNQNRISGS